MCGYKKGSFISHDYCHDYRFNYVTLENAISIDCSSQALAYLKHVLLPIKKELSWYTTIGLFGPILEIIIICTGVWYYAQNSLIHVPLWCPFAWGIAGTTVISLYSGIVNKKLAGRNNVKKTKRFRKNKFKT